MKQLLLLLTVTIVFFACKSGAKIQDYPVPQDEKYIAEPISRDSANILIRNYQQDGAFRGRFRNGMFIPMKVIDALREEQGLGGVSIYYGKHPDYASPVFLIFSTTSAFQYKSSGKNAPFASSFIVYYPCPTQCG